MNGIELKQQRNLESIEEFKMKYPFSHTEIKKFYHQHAGNGPNSFIQTNFN